MTDYISRGLLKEAFEEDGHLSAYVEEMIDSIPAADVRPVVRAVWCPQPSEFENCTLFACSNCGHLILLSNDREELPYCGNCGAQMSDKDGEV